MVEECKLLFWKLFNEALQFIKNNITWIIRNEEKISIGDLNWILCKEGLRKPKSSISSQNLFEKDLWDRKGRWDERKICSLFNDPPKDIDDILKIYIPYNKIKDKKVWIDFTKYAYKSRPLLLMAPTRCLEKCFGKPLFLGSS